VRGRKRSFQHILMISLKNILGWGKEMKSEGILMLKTKLRKISRKALKGGLKNEN